MKYIICSRAKADGFNICQLNRIATEEMIVINSKELLLSAAFAPEDDLDARVSKLDGELVSSSELKSIIVKRGFKFSNT